MLRRERPSPTPLPPEILDWQVALRRKTMFEHDGAPHAGVAPLVLVRRPGPALGVVAHSVICGLLPHERLLTERTKAFDQIYEAHVADGARAVYDRGIEYLESYYEKSEDFDPYSITTLLHRDLPLTRALQAARQCALLFYVFNLTDKSEAERLRCLHVDCSVEVLEDGPVYENVWLHNTLFHGPAEGHVVIHFRHLATWDTRFGTFEELKA